MHTKEHSWCSRGYGTQEIRPTTVRLAPAFAGGWGVIWSDDMTEPDPFGLTLTDAIASLEARGFTGSFRAETAEQVRCLACGRARHADELPMLAFERIEGASDPADESIVAAIECPDCGARGTPLLPFGSRAMRIGAGVLSHMHTSPPPREH